MEEEGLSLGQIWTVFKKCFRNGAIFSVCSAVVVGGALLVARSFLGRNTYQSTVTYYSTEEDVSAKMYRQKSAMIAVALKQLYNDDTQTIAKLSPEVNKNLAIVQQYDDKADPKNPVPTNTYDIVLTPSSKLNLSHGEYITLQREITNAYLKFNPTGAVINTLDYAAFTYDTENALKTWEYITIYNDVIAHSQTVVNQINTAIEKDANLSNYAVINPDGTQERSVTAIVKELGTVQNTLTHYLGVAQDQYLMNTKALSPITTTLSIQIENMKKDLEAYKNTRDSAQKQLDDYIVYLNSKTGASVGDITLGGSTADTTVLGLAQALQTATVNYENCAAEIAKLEDRLDRYQLSAGATKAELCAETEAALTTATTKINALVTEYNVVVNDFNQNYYNTNEASIDMETRIIYDNPVSMVVIAGGAAVAVVLSFIASYAQTFIRLKKQGFFDATVVEETNA